MENSNFNTHILPLIIDELEGGLTAEQKEELNSWRCASVENEKQYQQFCVLQSEIDSLFYSNKVNADRAWAKVDQEIDKSVKMDNAVVIEPVAMRKEISWKWVYSLAASVILVACLYFYNNAQSQLVQTASGESRKIVLPDGSSVTLNENSEIEYNKQTFISERKIVLVKGEAYFDIVHNSTNPLIVRTSNAIIEDIGTSFNIKDANKDVSVCVTEGSVSLKSLNNSGIILKPGQKGVYSSQKNTLNKYEDFAQSEIAWVDKGLRFENVPLREIVAKLSQVYKVNIKISTPSLENRKLTATLNFHTVDSALSVISTSLQVKVIKEGDRYLIKK